MAGKRLPILADERERGVLSDEGDMNVVSLNHPSTVGFKSLYLTFQLEVRLCQILCLPFHRKSYLQGRRKEIKGTELFNTTSELCFPTVNSFPNTFYTNYE